MLALWNSAPRTSFGGFNRAGLFLRGQQKRKYIFSANFVSGEQSERAVKNILSLARIARLGLLAWLMVYGIN